jgi:hypothetical protein
VPAHGDTITLRHDHVDHEEVHPTLRELQGIEGLGAGLSLEYPVALVAENPVGYAARDLLMVDNQDRCGGTGK